jgi:hypothetical protein
MNALKEVTQGLKILGMKWLRVACCGKKAPNATRNKEPSKYRFRGAKVLHFDWHWVSRLKNMRKRCASAARA